MLDIYSTHVWSVSNLLSHAGAESRACSDATAPAEQTCKARQDTNKAKKQAMGQAGEIVEQPAAHADVMADAKGNAQSGPAASKLSTKKKTTSKADKKTAAQKAQLQDAQCMSKAAVDKKGSKAVVKGMSGPSPEQGPPPVRSISKTAQKPQTKPAEKAGGGRKHSTAVPQSSPGQSPVNSAPVQGQKRKAAQVSKSKTGHVMTRGSKQQTLEHCENISLAANSPSGSCDAVFPCSCVYALNAASISMGNACIVCRYKL